MKTPSTDRPNSSRRGKDSAILRRGDGRDLIFVVENLAIAPTLNKFNAVEIRIRRTNTAASTPRWTVAHDLLSELAGELADLHCECRVPFVLNNLAFRYREIACSSESPCRAAALSLEKRARGCTIPGCPAAARS